MLCLTKYIALLPSMAIVKSRQLNVIYARKICMNLTIFTSINKTNELFKGFPIRFFFLLIFQRVKKNAVGRETIKRYNVERVKKCVSQANFNPKFKSFLAWIEIVFRSRMNDATKMQPKVDKKEMKNRILTTSQFPSDKTFNVICLVPFFPRLTFSLPRVFLLSTSRLTLHFSRCVQFFFLAFSFSFCVYIHVL